MLLYIIRHGEPDYTTDTLTETGWRQAEAVARRMASYKIDRIFSSPFGRARQTSEPTARMLGLDVSIEEWAHEIGSEIKTPHPNGEFKSISLLQNTYLLENGNYDLGFHRALECPGFRESQMKSVVDYLTKNGNDFLERLGYREENGVYRILRPNEEKVALFCHAAMGRAWLSILLHIPINVMWASFSYQFTGVTVLEFKNNENGITAPNCLCYSDVSHLYAEGLDLLP